MARQVDADPRQARLGAALRANLRRRKAQAHAQERARSGGSGQAEGHDPERPAEPQGAVAPERGRKA